MARPNLTVRRHPYEEPYHTQLEILVSNGPFRGTVDLYCGVQELSRIGRGLKAFPRKVGDEYRYEYGSPDPTVRFYRHFLLRAYTIDGVGHCAIQFVIDRNEEEPNEGRCTFSIHAEAAAINRLGELFEQFALLEHLEFVWGPALAELHADHGGPAV